MDISVLILLAVICVAIAVLIGYLLGSIFSSKAAKPPPEAQQKGLDYHIGFYTDRQVRQFVLEMDGKTIKAPHLLKEPEQRRLVLLFQALGRWLDLEPVPLAKPNQATSPEAAAPESLPPAQPAKSLPAQDAVLFSEAPEASVLASGDASPARPGIIDWLAQAVQPKVRVSEPPKSIAMQVDEILQRRLQEKGWQQRGIRLLELPNKGMVVMVGLNQYVTVEDVPDAEIQAVLRDSVREWETKMYGG
jgi:hypothetical protein